jgi:hypothetical protein
MNNRKKAIFVVALMLLQCIVKPVSAKAQETVPPPIVVGVSLNGSGLPVICRGWPCLASVLIMNENAYQRNIPVSLSTTWKSSLHFVVKDSEGKIVNWPFHIVSNSDENIVLDSIAYAQIGYWLEPSETNQIPVGQYELTAILDSTAYGSLGSKVLSARSNPLTISISNEPGSLTVGQKTARDLLSANLFIFKGDDQKALEYLSGILGYNPTDLSTLTSTGSILESEGDFGGALYAYSRSLEIFYAANPDPAEPPIELLKAQKALFYKLDNSASFVVTLAAKDSAHPSYGRGSASAYSVDNIPARELELVRGRTYTFHLKNIPSSDPLYLSTSVKGGGAEPYTAGVSGTPGSSNDVVTFAVGKNTPDVLYYQSSQREYVGWRMNVTDNDNVTSVAPNNSKAPHGYSLSTAYPNPFNPSTRIQYSLQKAGNVRLTVFDILGKQVAILVDESKEAGSYQVQWNPQLPSGVYFYRLQAGEFVQTKKVILLR